MIWGGHKNKKVASFPKLQACHCERADLRRGEWRCRTVAACRPRRLLIRISEDNMAAAGRNLPLERRIKAAGGRTGTLLSNIQPGWEEKAGAIVRRPSPEELVWMFSCEDENPSEV